MSKKDRENAMTSDTESTDIPEPQNLAENTNENPDGEENLDNTKEGEDSGMQAKYAELELKLSDMNDQFLRKAADFENFRKRANREKQELVEFANQSLLSDLLPVIDDFERAIKSAETSKDFSVFFDGITMIEKSLSAMLESKWGLKRFDSEGELFDPNRHEAVQMEKSPDVKESKVKEEFLKGYTLRDRVIRYAMVSVLMPEEGKD